MSRKFVDYCKILLGWLGGHAFSNKNSIISNDCLKFWGTLLVGCHIYFYRVRAIKHSVSISPNLQLDLPIIKSMML